MLNRRKSRLVAAAAVTGTVCALAAATAASATPTPPWSGHQLVPHAFTNATPGLAAINLTDTGVRGTFITWKGQYDDEVHYQVNINGHWSQPFILAGAATSAAPSAASYVDPTSHDAVVVAWKQQGSDNLYYDQGEVASDGAISWTGPVLFTIGSSTTSNRAPSIFFPLNAVDKVIFSYRGPHDHVRYDVGKPDGRAFDFLGSHVIGTAADTHTSAAPDLAEIENSGSAAGTGVIYVFWKNYAAKTISYATTSDPLNDSTTPGDLTWSTATLVPGAATTAGPAASTPLLHGFAPLLLVYKGGGGLEVKYQELSANGPTGTWTAPAPVLTGRSTTAIGPALLNGILATVIPNSSGDIYFHHFSS
jgi:hypothetical protein